MLVYIWGNFLWVLLAYTDEIKDTKAKNICLEKLVIYPMHGAEGLPP